MIDRLNDQVQELVTSQISTDNRFELIFFL